MLELETLCLRMEQQQTNLLAELHAWPKNYLSFRPSPDAWCAAQVLDHIVKVEAGTAEDVRLAITNPGPPISSEDTQRARGLIRWLLSTGRVQVPQSEAQLIWPDTDANIDACAAKWQATRQRLLSMARTCTTGDRALIIHPGSGAMDMTLVLEFLHAHTRHHEHQLARLHKDASTLRT